jgi:hypothetical protein
LIHSCWYLEFSHSDDYFIVYLIVYPIVYFIVCFGDCFSWDIDARYLKLLDFDFELSGHNSSSEICGSERGS